MNCPHCGGDISARAILLHDGIMRPATEREYKDWLAGYMAAGGAVTHRYDYPFPEERFFVALQSFVIPEGVCGASSFSVIVPSDLAVNHEGFDHCDIFPMDYKMKPSWVSAYQGFAA